MRSAADDGQSCRDCRKWSAGTRTNTSFEDRGSRKMKVAADKVAPMMLVAVEGLAGALVEALAYSAPALQDFRAGGPAAGCEERVVRSRSAIDRKAIMNRTFAVTVAATAYCCLPKRPSSSRRPREHWSVDFA
jgi:hypothetical protein